MLFRLCIYETLSLPYSGARIMRFYAIKPEKYTSKAIIVCARELLLSVLRVCAYAKP
jgi:hypothetical protein